MNEQEKQLRIRAGDLTSKQCLENTGQPNLKRERFLAMLKKRHGYTNEKAVDELERLLKQFYRVNRSFSSYRIRLNIEHPLGE